MQHDNSDYSLVINMEPSYQNSSVVIEMGSERDLFLTPKSSFFQPLLDFDTANREVWLANHPPTPFDWKMLGCCLESNFCWFWPATINFIGAINFHGFSLLYQVLKMIFFYPIGFLKILLDLGGAGYIVYMTPQEVLIRAIYMFWRIAFPAALDIYKRPFQYAFATSTATFFAFFHGGEFMWIVHLMREAYSWYGTFLVLNHDATIFLGEIDVRVHELINLFYSLQITHMRRAAHQRSDPLIFRSSPLVSASSSSNEEAELLIDETSDETPVETEIIVCDSSASELSSSSSYEETSTSE